ncbi:MAG: hypothetical protein QOH97_4776 [Actinoplanes sp.]|jgi:uncharacterized protein (DUF305 family)|nr:hypothetical protein [Actinoplanes sp.]
MTASTETGPVATPAVPLNDPAPVRRFRRFAVIWLAVALVFGLLAGGLGGWVLAQPHNPADDSAEAGFLRDMSTHHAQAVELSMIAHAKSDNPAIVTLAGDIALTQHQQIGYMQAWLRTWGLSPTGSTAPMAWMPGESGAVVNGLMPGMATPAQLAELRTAAGTQLDIQYLTLMRKHHLGGLHMAQEILVQSKNKDVTWLAQTMVNGQQAELVVIADMLKQLGAS